MNRILRTDAISIDRNYLMLIEIKRSCVKICNVSQSMHHFFDTSDADMIRQPILRCHIFQHDNGIRLDRCINQTEYNNYQRLIELRYRILTEQLRILHRLLLAPSPWQEEFPCTLVFPWKISYYPWILPSCILLLSVEF